MTYIIHSKHLIKRNLKHDLQVKTNEYKDPNDHGPYYNHISTESIDKFPPIKLANTPTSALVPIIAPVIPADTPFTVVK